MYVCFFFKQKTAYEMRISDWSSDVCSSDLLQRPGVVQRKPPAPQKLLLLGLIQLLSCIPAKISRIPAVPLHRLLQRYAGRQPDHRLSVARRQTEVADGARRTDRRDSRRTAVRAARMARSRQAEIGRAHV